MSNLRIPSTPNHIHEVSRGELFYASSSTENPDYGLVPGRFICMLLPESEVGGARIPMLAIDDKGVLFKRDPVWNIPSTRWTFERYLTKDETVSISGSAPADIDKEYPPDHKTVPTHDEIRSSKDLGLIPDGVYYYINRTDGERSAAVNCPPGKNHVETSVRTICHIRPFNGSHGPSEYFGWDRLDLLQHDGYDFGGYILPENITPGMKRYPKP